MVGVAFICCTFVAKIKCFYSEMEHVNYHRMHLHYKIKQIKITGYTQF